VRTVPVIIVEVEREIAGALVAGAKAAAIGPLSGECLDEAFGLTVGLRAIRSGGAMDETEFATGGGKSMRTVADAIVGEDFADGDVVAGKEGDGLVEGGDDVGDFLIGFDAGKAQAGVIVDRDVDGFDPGTFTAVGTIARAANAWADEAAQLLDIEMEQFTGCSPFVTHDRRLGFEVTKPVQMMAAQDRETVARETPVCITIWT